MIDEKLKQFLLDEYSICSSKRKPRSKYLEREFKKRNTDLYNNILDKTKYMNNKYTFEHRLFMYINEYDNFPSCEKCGKLIIRKDIGLDGYPDNNLCHMCFRSDKTRKVCLEKYGVINPSQLQSVKNKKKETCLEHYGVDNPSKVQEIQDKKIQTNIERFGNESPMRNDQIKLKSKESFIKKYGVDNPSQLQLIKNKKKETCLAHYGVEHPSQSKEIIRKIKLKIQSDPDYFKKRYETQKQTCLKRYGTTHWMKTEKYQKIISDSLVKKLYPKLLQSKFVDPLFDCDYFVKNHKGKLKWKCKKCGKIFETIDDNCVLNMPLFVRCCDCYPLKTQQTSKYEDDIITFLRQLNIECESNTKKIIQPYELDIYIPSKQLAIEFDGLYWHNETRKPKDYHLNKTEMCESKGIQLIHIFEDEWCKNKKIIESRLKDILGIYDIKVGARKCTIKDIDSEISNQFLKENHVQGNIQSKIKLGLFYKDELISVMTFGQLRQSLGSDAIDGEYELLRFCNKLNYHIPGSASKLLTYFIKNYHPKKIISYCDRRWSQGKLYFKLGFDLKRITKPNYWYIVNCGRDHRYNWRKSELPKKLNNVDMTKTEHEIMLENNIFRIYDCGSYRFDMELGVCSPNSNLTNN